MSEFESELYPIDFEDPPGQLKNPTILTFWWTSREVRRVLSHSPWSERLRYHGETPFFCFHNGFCTYFETRKGLEDHYEEHDSHRLTRSDMISKESDAKVVRLLRRWNFPKVY